MWWIIHIPTYQPKWSPFTLSLFSTSILFQSLPDDAEYIAILNVKVSIPESLEGENFGDLVSSVLKRMADFKEDCLKRQASGADLNLGDTN